ATNGGDMRSFTLAAVLAGLAVPALAQEQGTFTLDAMTNPGRHFGFGYYITDKLSLRPSLGASFGGPYGTAFNFRTALRYEPRSAHRRATHGRGRAPRLLRAPPEVARRAEPRAQGRLLKAVREVRTARLRLRPFAPEHEPGLEALWNDPDVRRYLWDDEPVPSPLVREQIEASRRSFRERGFGHFAFWPLAAPADPASIAGFGGLRTIGADHEVELLYAVSPALGRRGLATEAAGAVLRFGFEEAGLAEILAGADPPNAASFRVMERLGIRSCGTTRSAAARRGTTGSAAPSGSA